ncbi:hypothetical protein V6N13_011421 [Hibiscus sabdariffa]
MKLTFNIVAHPDQLWVMVMRTNYKCVRDNLIRIVGDGSTVDFWWDAWLGDLGPLVNHVVDSWVEMARVCDLSSCADRSSSGCNITAAA